uniref:Secreted protein n=1 Tax=Heterorhabditis bacteriophora TaxID=37862 RepID=A0A1I7W9Y1_HETBA
MIVNLFSKVFYSLSNIYRITGRTNSIIISLCEMTPLHSLFYASYSVQTNISEMLEYTIKKLLVFRPIGRASLKIVTSLQLNTHLFLALWFRESFNDFTVRVKWCTPTKDHVFYILIFFILVVRLCHFLW